MSRREKLLQRFLSRPHDFTWSELITLLGDFDYKLAKSGKTGGSRTRFKHPRRPPLILHKPHPKPILKRYQIDDLIQMLRIEGLL